MGGKGSKGQIQEIDQNQWGVIGTDNQADIVQSNKGLGQAQIRYISKDPKHQNSKQLKIYQYRRDTDSPLVRCLGAQFSKSEHRTVCGNQQNVKVLTQRIPKLLRDMENLKFPQSLYILSQAFRGYEDLTNKAGVFQITDKMIGINNDGEVKVWLNENFAQNHPPFQRPILQKTMTTPQQLTQMTSQKRMIQTVQNLVQKKSQNSFPEQFNQQIYKSKTFYEAYHNLHDYIKNKNIYVPGKLLFNKNRNIMNNYSSYDNANNNNLNTPKLEPQYQGRTDTNTNRFTNQSANPNNLRPDSYVTNVTNSNNNNISSGSYNYTSPSNLPNSNIGSSPIPPISTNPILTFNPNIHPAQNVLIYQPIQPLYQTYIPTHIIPQPTTINISSGNSYGMTMMQPSRAGGIQRKTVMQGPTSVTTIQPAARAGMFTSKSFTPSKSRVAFSYQTNPQRQY